MKTAIAATLASLVALGACATTDDPTSSNGSDGKADDGETDDATRAKLLTALHTSYLDAVVHGQPNEVVVSSVRVAGDSAWITGQVQKRGGGEIDWANSDFADDIADGIFDGPHIEALMHRTEDGTWYTSIGNIGSTDVWWDGLWFRYALNCALFPDMGCVSTNEPTFGTDTRRDIVRAIRDQGLNTAVHGQPNELVFSWIRTGGDYAFATGRVQKPGGGELDWSNSDYASEISEGLFDGGHVEALLQKDGTGWKVKEFSIGSTDVWWSGVWINFESMSCALFPVMICEPSEH